MEFSRQEHWSGLPFPSPKETTERKKVKSPSHVWFFETPWIIAYQAPPSMEFSRQEYWSRLPWWVQLCGSLRSPWYCLSLGLEWKLTFSSPVATAEFTKCWHIECSTVTASPFKIWNSSTGIPSLPLALFIVILPKAHLTLHSRITGSRWVITPLWLSGFRPWLNWG